VAPPKAPVTHDGFNNITVQRSTFCETNFASDIDAAFEAFRNEDARSIP
jgi:hypothetical protein